MKNKNVLLVVLGILVAVFGIVIISSAAGPVFYVGPFATDQTVCGTPYTFDVPGYTSVWLTQTKNGLQTYDGIYSVPLTYTGICNQDEGTYSTTVYSLINSARGNYIGSATFTITPKTAPTPFPPTPTPTPTPTSTPTPTPIPKVVSGIPKYYLGPFETTSVICGQTYAFNVTNYSNSTIWLNQVKDRVVTFDGPFYVPMVSYTSVCNQDEGNYIIEIYSVDSGKRGSFFIGSTTFIIKPNFTVEGIKTVAPGIFTLEVDPSHDAIRSGWFSAYATAESFFKKYKGDMDVLVFVPTTSLVKSVNGQGICICAWGIKKSAEGIGYPFGGEANPDRFFLKNIIPVYESSSPYGKDYMYYLLHELGHGWSTFIAGYGKDGGRNPLKILEPSLGHWGYVSDNFDSVMAYGPSRMIDNNNGTFTPVWNSWEKLGYNDFDLYTMGLWPSEKVKPTFSIFDANFLTGGTIKGTRRDVAIQDILNLEGKRVPSFGLTTLNPSTNLRITFLIVHNSGGSAGELDKAITITKQMADLLPSRWSEATRGLSTATVFAPSLKVASNKKTLALLQTRTKEELQKEVVNILNQTHDDGPLLKSSIQEQQSNFQKAVEKTFTFSQIPPPPPPIPPPPTFSKCDQNHDNLTNVIDLQSLANVILSKNTCTYTCDLNQDSLTNVIDLQYLANVILGKNVCM